METDVLLNEMIVDRWPTMYQVHGQTYKGICTVTNANLRFKLKMLSGKGRYAPVGFTLLIRKCFIQQVFLKRSLFSRRVIITMITGERYEFSCPLFKAYRVMSAIRFMHGC